MINTCIPSCVGNIVGGRRLAHHSGRRSHVGRIHIGGTGVRPMFFTCPSGSGLSIVVGGCALRGPICSFVTPNSNFKRAF